MGDYRVGVTAGRSHKVYDVRARSASEARQSARLMAAADAGVRIGLVTVYDVRQVTV